MMDDERLVEKFGSWVRVQVAFYDFMFEQSLDTCATCVNETMIKGFADGMDPYEDAIISIEQNLPSFNEAWKAFNESINQA